MNKLKSLSVIGVSTQIELAGQLNKNQELTLNLDIKTPYYGSYHTQRINRRDAIRIYQHLHKVFDLEFVEPIQEAQEGS